MALDINELEARLDVLKRARYGPQLRVTYSDGTTVQYRSDAEIAAAIAALEGEIAALTSSTAPRFVRTSLRNGICG